MKMSAMKVCFSFLIILLVSSEMVSVSKAACVATELAPCLGAITAGTPPTKLCCTKLKEQQTCFCGYLKDPNLSKYVNSPNAKKVASTCGVGYPKC